MGDQQNPYTIMGMLQMMQPNKYIDPKYKDKALPLQSFYGEPTDAMGNKIQSFQDKQKEYDAWNAAHPQTQGTSLTSVPGSALEAKGSQARAMQDAGYGDWALLDPTMASSHLPSPTAEAGSVGATSGWNPANPASVYPTAGGTAGAAGTSGTSAAAQTNPIDMRQAYLDALSRPQGDNKMITPGANVPASKPLGTPSVMSAFLDQHPGGGTAAPVGGGYSNKPFFDTLNQLRTA